MRWSAENPLDTFKDHLWTNWVLLVVKTLIEIWVLLRNYDNRFVSLHWISSTCLLNGLLNIWPHIRCVVSIKINNLPHIVFVTRILILSLLVEKECNLIKILLISLVPDNIDSLMHSHTRVSIAVVFGVRSQNFIVTDLDELNLDWLCCL